MKWWLLGIVLLLAGGTIWFWQQKRQVVMSPRGEVRLELPYAKYSFARLVERGGVASEVTDDNELFFYTSEGRRISGQLHTPEGESRGIVVMARGYIDKETYKTGMGTRNAAIYYASRGYTTYAPDFSGYGLSDQENENAIGARLVKPVEILDLLASLPTDKPIYLWGHSNGGQIMLFVAEILGKRGDSRVKGLTLWAPVSKPFPYNILYYTDEADDQGKWLRNAVAEFEQDYDVYDYSIDRYFDWITMPIKIHQGTADDAIPLEWSDQLAEHLRSLDGIVTYHVYPGADHDMRPSWDIVVARDVAFFADLL